MTSEEAKFKIKRFEGGHQLEISLNGPNLESFPVFIFSLLSAQFQIQY